MKFELDPRTQIVSFQLSSVVRQLPFAQFGELLLNGSPASGEVAAWVTVAPTKQVGVTASGMLRVRQSFGMTKVALPVMDCHAYGDLSTENQRAWERLVAAGIIVPSTARRQPGEDRIRQVVIHGVVPYRTWEVEFGPDATIRDTKLKEGDWSNGDALEPWTLGNVNTEGQICWGSRPPVWTPTTTMEDIDFFFLTGAAFNSDWMPGEFQWVTPSIWRVREGRVFFGELGHTDEWTLIEKAEVRGGQTQSATA